MIKGNITSEARSATLTAVVTRADGTVENLGAVAYWHRNPFKRWAWAIRRSALRLFSGSLPTKEGEGS